MTMDFILVINYSCKQITIIQQISVTTTCVTLAVLFCTHDSYVWCHDRPTALSVSHLMASDSEHCNQEYESPTLQLIINIF